MEYKQYTCNGIKVNIATGDISTLRLLNTSYNYLSTIACREGGIDAIINCSYFTASGGYALGRNQGDDKNDTVDYSSTGYLSVAILKDGTYYAGELESWDYTSDVLAGFTPAVIIYQDGQLVSKFSSALVSSYAYKMGLATSVSLFGILSDKKTCVLATCASGLSGTNFVNYLTGTLGMSFDLLCNLDGGGSTEMIVDKVKVQSSTDSTGERKMYNGLAFINTSTASAIASTTTTTVTKSAMPFLERLSWEGMTDDYIVTSVSSPVKTGSKYYYNKLYNRFAVDNLWAPNCTFYAAGRSAEIADAEIASLVPGGNAKTWWTTSSWQKGSTPKVGAICVWGSSTSTYGHVAVVEHVNDDGSVIISQSSYTRASVAKMNEDYFKNKTHTLVVGQSGTVGSPFLGYIYNPYINDIRVARDSSKSQVVVLVQKIKARKESGSSAECYKGLYMPTGIYNVLDTKEADGYTWIKVYDNLWFASNDADGWTTTSLVEVKESVVEPVVENNTELGELKKQVTELSNEVNSLNSELEKLQASYKELQNKLDVANDSCDSLNNALDNYKTIINNISAEVKKVA